jgi:prepilin-type N-terminal cleavage/methylation domain-containing protein
MGIGDTIMKKNIACVSLTGRILGTPKGVTLVELMISMVVAAIVMIGVYSAYSAQTKSYGTQRELSEMQQNLRGTLQLMAWDLHNAQRDTAPRQRYHFLPGGYWLPSPVDTPSNAGLPGLSFQSLCLDTDGDGVADKALTTTYRVRFPADASRQGLYRQVRPIASITGPWDLVAEGIQAIGFAFAFDPNGKGLLARYNNNPDMGILWAVDSDNDGRLDAILDVNDDGVIDQKDDTDGDGFITPADDATAQLSTPVSFACVRAVRIFILAVSKHPSPENVIDNHYYVVGNRVIQPPQDRFLRRMATLDVNLHNYIR